MDTQMLKLVRSKSYSSCDAARAALLAARHALASGVSETEEVLNSVALDLARAAAPGPPAPRVRIVIAPAQATHAAP